MKTTVGLVIAAAFIPWGAGQAWAWGPVGHETVAYIAEDNLTPAAKKQVDSILGPDLEMADVANWADQVRATSRPDTAPWHFIDIEDRSVQTEDGEGQYCAKSACVTGQIEAAKAVLSDPKKTTVEKFEPLKFLIHFVGDAHQPLHCSDDNDRGGNNKIVRYLKPGAKTKGTKINLHAYWDHLTEVKTVETGKELATELEDKITTKNRTDWASLKPEESFQIANGKIYSEFAPGPTSDPNGVPLPKDYYPAAKMKDVVDVQLEKAGIRLAATLNSIFR